MEYNIEFNYISPITKIIFSDNYVYLFIVTHSDQTDVYIHKIVINNLNNVTDTTRGYLLNRTVQVSPSISGPNVNVRLYCHSIDNNTATIIGLC